MVDMQNKKTIKPNQTKPNPIYLIDMYKEDLTLNNLQWLICHKTQRNQIKFTSDINIYAILFSSKMFLYCRFC